ncbi:hypothetical protein J2S72_001700 [Peptoniphilus koenoeneniae]|uniref:SLH domain-containing protein n=1 Tax=Peptoniphilus koenoeneniae TaxID=507751 RepID=A0ABU0AWM4_9FIRM|nr:S-layer homology domain-containing protein [Peptoniphilus koenoeneniae]MDQ0275664.1 hypothetical protein [Peptoniphilus koenoeneniae]
MNKKFLSLVLSLVMVLGTFTSVFAADSKVEAKKEEAKKTSPSAKIQWMVDQKLVEGRKIFKPGEEKNDLALDKNITRAEVTKMLVYAKGQEKLADLVKATSVPYSDVKADHWANGFVTVGTFKLKGPKGVAMLAGYPDGTFKPEKNVSYAELAKMLVALVKEDLTPQMVANAQWPGSWLTWAAELGILNGIEYANSNDPATRNLAFQMIYNAMYIYDTRHDVDYGTRIGVVSGFEDGKLVINQGDKQFKVTLDAKTTYVDGSGRVGYLNLQQLSSNSKLWVGSLVEVITDKNEKDGVVSHIMELGNPAVGATDGLKNNNRWYGVAEKTVQGVANVTKDDITVYAKDGLNGAWDVKNAEDGKGAKADVKDFAATKVEFTADTRFFVADENNGWLTEVDKTKARDLVEVKDGRFVPKVYVGYDVVGKTGRQYNKANIVVFNVVTDDQLNEKTFRVAHVTNRNFELTVENTKGQQTALDMRSVDNWFPGFNRPRNGAGYNDYFEKFDVIKARVNADNKVGKFGEVIIDYSKDPIFKIKEVHKTYGQVTGVTLEGRDRVVTPEITLKHDANIFLEGQLEKGAYVQVAKSDYQTVKDAYGYDGYSFKNMFISTISVVPAVADKDLGRLSGEYAEDWTIVKANFTKAQFGDQYTLVLNNVKHVSVDGTEAVYRNLTVAVSVDDYNKIKKNDDTIILKRLDSKQYGASYTNALVLVSYNAEKKATAVNEYNKALKDYNDKLAAYKADPSKTADVKTAVDNLVTAFDNLAAKSIETELTSKRAEVEQIIKDYKTDATLKTNALAKDTLNPAAM